MIFVAILILLYTILQLENDDLINCEYSLINYEEQFCLVFTRLLHGPLWSSIKLEEHEFSYDFSTMKKYEILI